MEQVALVQVEQGHGNLLGHSHYLSIIEHEFTLVKKIEKTTLVDKLCDHVEVRLVIKTNTHVKHNVWMSQLVEHLNLLDEVFQCLLRQITLAKALDCHLGSHPSRLIDISIASTSNQSS